MVCYFQLLVVVAINWEHFFELAMVRKVYFVSTVTTIFILDMINNIGQHDHELSLVKKNSTCLTSRVTTSGARIDDLVALFCTSVVVLKSGLGLESGLESIFARLDSDFT